MEIPARNGDGYLVNMNAWTSEIGRATAEADGYLLDDGKWVHIMKARGFYKEGGPVPPIRIFAKFVGQDKNDIFEIWQTGPMKAFTGYGGLPKPTGCV